MDLSRSGISEHNGVLIQDFGSGKAMQVCLLRDRVQVLFRVVQVDRMTDSETPTPRWLVANGWLLARWWREKSPVWWWLKEKGINEAVLVPDLLDWI